MKEVIALVQGRCWWVCVLFVRVCCPFVLRWKSYFVLNFGIHVLIFVLVISFFREIKFKLFMLTSEVFILHCIIIHDLQTDCWCLFSRPSSASLTSKDSISWFVDPVLYKLHLVKLNYLGLFVLWMIVTRLRKIIYFDFLRLNIVQIWLLIPSNNFGTLQHLGPLFRWIIIFPWNCS